MKVLITKSDGTPTKSKVHAKQFLSKLGMPEDCLIEENGQFYYEGVNDSPSPQPSPQRGEGVKEVTWETPVFDKNNEKTKLFIPGTDVIATINAKLPAGQLRGFNAFEICIENENFAMSLDLVSKIFKARG